MSNGQKLPPQCMPNPTSFESTLPRARYIHRLGMAGLSRNIGFGANKVFANPLLQMFHASQPLIGFILGLEGLLGLLLNPLTGWMSDRTHRRGLRRKIYVLVGLPLAGTTWLWFCISHNFASAAVAITLFYFSQQLSVSPYQAWMPELTPPEHWGLASGYLNLWWEVGNLIAFLAIPLVYQDISHLGAFVLTAILIMAGGLVTGIAVPESPANMDIVNKNEVKPPRPSYRKLMTTNLVLYFLSQTFAWLAFEAIASFFTQFMVHRVHGTLLDGALAMSLFTFTGMGGALLFGRFYRRWRPKSLLAVCLGIFGALAVLGLFIQTIVAVFVVVGIEGIFWAGDLTLAYAFATDLLREVTSGEEEADAMRGSLYGIGNVVQSIGLLVAAPTAGIVIHLSNNNYAGMFLVSSVAGFLAMTMVLMVRQNPTIQLSQ